MEKRKILLVDDVSLFIQLEKSFLSRDLFEITTARSGKEALNSIRTAIPDLVLLDLYMPDMNGDAVCREIKNDPLTKDIPIIIVSSEGDEEMEQRCQLSGCDGFLHKPIRRDLLLAAVEKQLKVKHRHHARINTDLSCTVRHNDQLLESTIRSLSQSGAFIEPGFMPDLGETLMVAFCIPDSGKTLKLEASVRWTGMHKAAASPGAGVKFTRIDGSETFVIRQYVESILEKQNES